MQLGQRVLRLVTSQDGQTRIYECRECGTTVSQDTDQCPDCGSTGIARYEIE